MMRTVIRLCAAVALAVLLGVDLFAAPLSNDLEIRDAYEFKVGEFSTIPVNNPARVSIDDPSVVDIKNASAQELFLEAKKQGRTWIRLWNEDGLRTSLEIMVTSGNVGKLYQQINRLLEDAGFSEYITVTLDKDSGMIILNGEIEESQQENLKKIVETYKDKVTNLVFAVAERGQVEIEAQIIELTESAAKTLGFSWFSSMDFNEQNLTSGRDFWDLFEVGNEWTRSNLAFTINALESSGQLRILSRPKMMCSSGKKAKLNVGGTVPVLTQSLSGDGLQEQMVDYKEYGVTLTIEPVVEKKTGNIQLKILADVSDVVLETASGAAQAEGGALVPAFTKTSASTELYLKDGQTVFIGGLIKSKSDTDIAKVPWLADVPILGKFFTNKQKDKDSTELMISLTPRLAGEKKPEIPAMASEAANDELVGYATLPPSMQRYVYSLRNTISRAALYPQLAKMAGYEGVAGLNLHLLASGELREVIVSRSSGSDMLDQAALATVQSLTPFAPFPKDSKIQDLWVDIPVVFKLE
jgi:pilus assembly protein CpaC